MPENKTSDARPSLGEIAAFITETRRIAHDRRLPVADRAEFYEWKADLFARLGEPESVRTAAAEAARLRGAA